MNLHVFLFLELRAPVCFANILEKLREEVAESASLALHSIFALPNPSPEPRYHPHGECSEFVPPQSLVTPHNDPVRLRLRPPMIGIDLSQFLSQLLLSRIRTCSKNTGHLLCPLNGSTKNTNVEFCIANNRMQHMRNASIIIVFMILHMNHLNESVIRYVFQKFFF